MKKVKVSCFCEEAPKDILWFTVEMNENNHVLYSTENDDSFGSGRVFYESLNRWHSFNLYWLDDGSAGLDWIDCNDPSAEIDILDRRLVIGESITFTEQGEKYVYSITEMLMVNDEPA